MGRAEEVKNAQGSSTVRLPSLKLPKMAIFAVVFFGATLAMLAMFYEQGINGKQGCEGGGGLAMENSKEGRDEEQKGNEW
jgi:hypothetical protein